MVLPKKVLKDIELEKRRNEALKRLRASAKWQHYFETLRPKDDKGGDVPFPKVTGEKGLCLEDFKKHIDKLVLTKVDKANPKNSFDNFYKEYKKK